MLQIVSFSNGSLWYSWMPTKSLLKTLESSLGNTKQLGKLILQNFEIKVKVFLISFETHVLSL